MSERQHSGMWLLDVFDDAKEFVNSLHELREEQNE